MIFETCGHLADGSQLDTRYKRDIEYPVLRDFFTDVRAKKIPNITIEKTEFAEKHLNQLKSLKDLHSAFNQYRQENLSGFGDDDIIKLLNRNEHHGRIYVLTEDRGLSERIGSVKTASGKSVSVIDTIAFCDDTQRSSPAPWVAYHYMLDQIKDTINHYRKHDNLKRDRYGRGGKHWLYDDDYQGFVQLGHGEPRFGKALRDMMNFEERGRR